MLSDLARDCPDIPDVWGEGAIFAFSGMDGETNAASGFVATHGREPGEILFHTPRRRLLNIAVSAESVPRIATGDVYAADTPAGDLLLTFSAWHTLVGVLPHNTSCALHMEGESAAARADGLWISEDTNTPDVLAAAQRGGRFALSYGATSAEACDRASQALGLDPFQVASQRLAAYKALPSLEPKADDRLLKKCFSVMRVNTLSREGFMEQAWSTPDRVPHKDMWLWDSVFHSLGMNLFDPRLSWQFLKSMLDTQNPDGYIPHQTSVSGAKSAVTQPPLLAWGVWENYQELTDRDCLEYALPRLEGYLSWNLAHRDLNHNGLLEWLISDHARCRCGESGLDNSPRFDRGGPLDSVDFSTIQAHDMMCTSRIAAALGQQDKAKLWMERSRAMSDRIHRELWDDPDGFYYDRDMDGDLERVKAVSGFFPLMLGDMPAGRADRLASLLRDPGEFDAPFPVPTVALSEPTWSTDMWRGATWANTNYLVIHGLLAQGKQDEAARLAQSTVAHVRKHYERFGVLFEFFDSKDEVAPLHCDRKGPCDGPYDIRAKVHCIRDYHWTAAVTACLLLNEDLEAPTQENRT